MAMFLGGYDCILSESQDLGCYCSLVYSNLQRKTAALIISTSNNTHVILYTEKYSCELLCDLFVNCITSRQWLWIRLWILKFENLFICHL